MLHTVRDYFTIGGGREGGKNKCHARGYELPLTQFFSPRNPLVLKVFKTFTKQLLSQTLYLGIYQSASCKRFNFFIMSHLVFLQPFYFFYYFFLSWHPARDASLFYYFFSTHVYILLFACFLLCMTIESVFIHLFISIFPDLFPSTLPTALR